MSGSCWCSLYPLTELRSSSPHPDHGTGGILRLSSTHVTSLDPQEWNWVCTGRMPVVQSGPDPDRSRAAAPRRLWSPRSLQLVVDPLSFLELEENQASRRKKQS